MKNTDHSSQAEQGKTIREPETDQSLLNRARKRVCDLLDPARQPAFNLGEATVLNDVTMTLLHVIEEQDRRLRALERKITVTDSRDKFKALEQLMDAARTGSIEDAKAAILAGADVNERNQSSWETPLHRAAAWDNSDIIRFLLDNGANINASDVQGITPLHVAAKNDSLASVRVLVERGADLNAKDTNQSTALELAQKDGHHRVAAILTQGMQHRNNASNRGIGG